MRPHKQTKKNKQTKNKKDSNNFDKTGKKILIAKKEEREKNAQLFCFASLLRIYTFFLTFDTLCSFPQIVKPETDRSGGAWQLCLVLNSNKP